MEIGKNVAIYISDRSHINLTLNVYNCGNQDIAFEREVKLDSYAFYYVKDGSGCVTQRQITHKIQAGDGFVIYPNMSVSIKSSYKQTMNVTWVAFSGYLVERYLNRAKLSSYEPLFADTEDRELEGIFDTLLRVSMKMPNRYCKIMAQMYNIFAFLLDHIQDGVRGGVSTPESVLIRALDFIDSNYHEDISVEDIADSVGVNRKSLYTVFKNLTNFSPKDYLIYYRMCKATALLKEPELSVESVAVSVGYSDQFHFSKEFKKNVGMSPTVYRKAIAEDPANEYMSPIDAVRQQFPELSDDLPPRFE